MRNDGENCKLFVAEVCHRAGATESCPGPLGLATSRTTRGCFQARASWLDSLEVQRLRSSVGWVARYRLALSTCALAAAVTLFFILRGLAEAVRSSSPTRHKHQVAFEAAEGRSFPSSLIPGVQSALARFRL